MLLLTVLPFVVLPHAAMADAGNTMHWSDDSNPTELPTIRREYVKALRLVVPEVPLSMEPYRYTVGCTVEVTIGADGRPLDVEPVGCGEDYFDATTRALAASLFQPFFIDGQPHPVRFTFHATFMAGVLPEDAPVQEATRVFATHKPLPGHSDGCEIAATVHADGAVLDLSSSDSLWCQAVLDELPPGPRRLERGGDQEQCVASFVGKAEGAGRLKVEGCPAAFKRATRRVVRSWGWYDGDYSATVAWVP